MFGETLKAMRKAKGYTQEELAIKLNVVRQTVSKWEKGLSVPDADLLLKLADVLDTTVSVLLGGTVSEGEEGTEKDAIAQQLAKISEQMAIKNWRSQKLWRIVGVALLAVLIFHGMLLLVGLAANTSFFNDAESIVIEVEEAGG
ncbi:MAG TPA: transcriptional regulator [Clostridiales bacterium]|nr:transcriptional regulator [Clostridiales bacterium]